MVRIMTFLIEKISLFPMPKVNVDVPSKLSPQETFSKIKTIFGENSEIKKFDAQMNCTFDDAKLSGSAKGGKFSADILVSPQGSEALVQIIVEVPLLLGAFKGQIKSTIEKKLLSLLS
jgi:hypothetical protein